MKMTTIATTAAITRLLALASIHPSKDNPRRAFDKVKLAELAASIKEKGVLEPIMVRPVGKDFLMIFGERRWRAAQMAGLTHIPCVIREDITDDEAAEIRLIENLQRHDPASLDEALA